MGTQPLRNNIISRMTKISSIAFVFLLVNFLEVVVSDDTSWCKNVKHHHHDHAKDCKDVPWWFCEATAIVMSCDTDLMKRHCPVTCNSCDYCVDAIGSTKCWIRDLDPWFCKGKDAFYCRRTCKKCDPNGHWTNWSEWSACSKTCGAGEKEQTRTCTNPKPQHGGKPCEGENKATASCNDGPCPIDGGWSNWGKWGECSVTCGDGKQSRERQCNNPKPQHGGANCKGDATGTQICNSGPCPIDGGRSDWSKWGACSATCGNGTKEKSRTCTNPKPQHGGKDCQGENKATGACNNGPCPVDGGWSDWSKWGDCSTTCGNGTKEKSRSCTNPKPQHGGKACQGENKATGACNNGPCPVDGGWSDWS